MDRNGGSDGSCHYSVLGIRKDASHSDIRSAYRKLALKWHPDRLSKNPSLTGNANHHQRFQRIQEAYSVLSDEKKRSMYDSGTLNLFDDDEDDEGMGEFMHDLFKMMDNNNRVAAAAACGKGGGGGGEVRKEESLEDLQRSFMETFGADLASYLTSSSQDHHHQSKTSSSRSRTTPYDRATPKRTANSTTSNSRAARC
ncbi:chaperone protein DnaJ-like isoform X1 [Impatiens glandulifera]|uniref:chaperone protein DnaJ-like isoform X1 n=1 Tax=Impatiens glandulifera TaxID=253017 RepID=UPI001FB0FE62|nr:chaperone protein DnaJ-like isoform X1 [Impatiens glandulifera]